MFVYQAVATVSHGLKTFMLVVVGLLVLPLCYQCVTSALPVYICPQMFVYQAVATVSHSLNTFMLVVVGLLVNGPYALISTAVSADLGTSPSLQGNSRALATVTAIIDGRTRPQP